MILPPRETQDFSWLDTDGQLRKLLRCLKGSRPPVLLEQSPPRPQARLLVILLLVISSVLFNPLFAQEHKESPSEFNLILAGDSIIVTPITVHKNLHESGADLSERKSIPCRSITGYLDRGRPCCLEGIQWMGFDLFSTANNHLLDFGTEGLQNSIQVLKRNGAVYAGIGENLGEARAPGYLSTAHGRVGLVACAATFPQDAPAGETRPDMQGRPGVDPLHHQTRYGVDAASFEALQKIRDELKLGSGRGRSNSSQTLSFPVDGSAPITLEVSDKPGVITTADPADLAGLTHSIQDAKEMADYVVISVHSYEGIRGPNAIELPAQFLVQSAHAAIDAGADVFVSHGPHALRGIEIYKGKVIFYSLGNFVFENDLVVPQPTEFYQQCGLGFDALPSEAHNARSDHDRRSFPR